MVPLESPQMVPLEVPPELPLETLLVVPLDGPLVIPLQSVHRRQVLGLSSASYSQGHSSSFATNWERVLALKKAEPLSCVLQSVLQIQNTGCPQKSRTRRLTLSFQTCPVSPFPSRYMYWTDWGEEPRIECAGMDGSSRYSGQQRLKLGRLKPQQAV